jgi:HEAT repeat protein
MCIRDRYIVEPARERIVSFGAQALPFLASKLSTESARERLALESILPRIYARDSAAVARLLLDSLRSGNPRTLSLVATVVGRVRLRAARAELERLLRDPVWRIRALAAQQLGELGDPGAISALRPLLRDEHPLVRARAAFALLQLQPRQLEVWQQALADPSQLVRYGAVQGALRHGRLPATLVQELWRLPLELRARQSLGWLVAGVDTAASPRTFARLLQQQPAPLRRVAYSVLRDQRSPWSARLRAECARLESDPALRGLLQ